MFEKYIPDWIASRFRNSNDDKRDDDENVFEQISELDHEKNTIFKAGILHIVLGFACTLASSQPFQYLLASDLMYGEVVQGFFAIPIGILYILTRNDFADRRYAMAIFVASVVSLLTSFVSVITSGVGIGNMGCDCQTDAEECVDCEKTKQTIVYSIGILLGVIQVPFASWVAYASYCRYRHEVPNVIVNAEVKMVARGESSIDSAYSLSSQSNISNRDE